MGTFPVTLDEIKNKACIVCGAGFTIYRVGKLYCSSKCKQFAFNHRGQIKSLRGAKMGIEDSSITLSLKEYESYKSIVEKIKKLKDLKHREMSSYLILEPFQAVEMEKLKKNLPEYLQKIKARNLSLEEWSFLKTLYPHLKKEEFFKVISSFDYQFWENLVYSSLETKREKFNPIKISFQNHLSKIADGQIKFK